MTVRTEVIADAGRMAAVFSAWDALVVDTPSLADGLDPTNGPVWFSALRQAFPQAQAARLVVAWENGEVVGVLPLVQEPGRRASLMLASELYGGRTGFLLKRQDPDLLRTMIHEVGHCFGPWTCLRLMLVRGGPSARLLEQAARQWGLRTLEEPGWESPHFPLLPDGKQFESDMSKGLKQTLRTAANKFAALGSLRWSAIGRDSVVEEVLQAVLDIERGSWKHASGTAITNHPEQETFYRAFFPLAQRAGILAGMILYLDSRPIAHNFGVMRGPAYCCLKHSNLQEFQNLSPSQLLNANLIQSLRLQGVQTYDFMGKSEPHKLRWSKHTGAYVRDSVWIYAPGVSGTLLHSWHRLKRRARDLAQRWIKLKEVAHDAE